MVKILLTTKEMLMKKIWTILVIISLSLFAGIPVLAEPFQGVKYTVIGKSNLGSIKCSIDIRLEKKVTKEFLHKLALKLRKAEPREYDHMFITYYLPGMTPGSGAWATSHFDPNLEVKILGTTIEEERALMDEPKNSSGEIIGKWRHRCLYGGPAVYTLLKRDGKVILLKKFHDGSSGETEMQLKKGLYRDRYEEKGGAAYSDYYIINRKGELEIYDSQGLILTMHSIK